MPRFAANVSMLFTEVPFLERFAASADAGFSAVEFMFGYAHPVADIVTAVRAHDLRVVLMNAPPGDFAAGDRGLAALPERRDEFRASIATALEYASALECPSVHVMAGVVPPADDQAMHAQRHEEHRAVLVDNLRWACREAQARDVTLLLEALNPGDVPNYFYSRQAEVHAIRSEVAAPNLKAQMDLYHTQRVEGALTEKLQRWLPDIGHIQVASVPGRHEPDVGEIDCRYMFRLIDELGYAGWIGCEYRPRAGTLAGLGWREALTRAEADGPG
ncbi:MAG: 2-oxo-tetronate isomerase [Casimicrobiaceae bacterium]